MSWQYIPHRMLYMHHSLILTKELVLSIILTMWKCKEFHKEINISFRSKTNTLWRDWKSLRGILHGGRGRLYFNSLPLFILFPWFSLFCFIWASSGGAIRRRQLTRRLQWKTNCHAYGGNQAAGVRIRVFVSLGARGGFRRYLGSLALTPQGRRNLSLSAESTAWITFKCCQVVR